MMPSTRETKAKGRVRVWNYASIERFLTVYSIGKLAYSGRFGCCFGWEVLYNMLSSMFRTD